MLSVAAATAVVGASLLTACSPPQATPTLTIAATASSHEPLPTLTALLLDQVEDRAAGAVYPGDGAVQLVVQGQQPITIDLTPMRGDEVEASSSRAAELIEDNLVELDRALGTGATTDGLDTLGVLDRALQVTPEGGTVVLLTSGLSTADPLDLSTANWFDDPTGLIAAIDPAALPSAAGRDLVFIGLGTGDPGGAQVSVDPATRASLITIWEGICELMDADSCAVHASPAGNEDPVSTNSVPIVSFTGPTTPIAATPPASTAPELQTAVDAEACAGTTTLATDILFAADSSVLSEGADQALQPVVDVLIACPSGREVHATGHTATVPGRGDGISLSQERAQAVLDRLRHLGAPERAIGTATGLGNTSQPHDNLPHGLWDDALAAQNRVVILTITTA